MKRTAGLLAGFVFAVALAPVCAQARNGTDNLGAAIRFERYQTNFSIGSGTSRAQVDEVGLALRQYFGRDFSLAMAAGYTDLSFDANPAAANLSPSGFYGRLSARYRWRIAAHFAFGFTGAGAYHRLSNSNSNGSIVDRWWSYSVAAGPRYSMRRFSVAAGLVYRRASGSEASSRVPGEQFLGFLHTTNPYLDFDFTVTPGGTFGVHVEGGARRSVAFVFGYRFVSP